MTFTVTSENVPDGVVLNWSLYGPFSTASNSDINPSSGSVTIQDSSAEFTVTAVADALDEGSEYFQVLVTYAGTTPYGGVLSELVYILDPGCPDPDTPPSSYSVTLVPDCQASWLGSVVGLNMPLLFDSGNFQAYQSGWEVFYSDYLITQEVLVRLEFSFGRPFCTVSIRAYTSSVIYGTIPFEVDCFDGSFVVSDTSGDPTENPGKPGRWSGGACTQDYTVYIAFEAQSEPFWAVTAPLPPHGVRLNASVEESRGVGAKLKGLLSAMGIKSSKGCSCNQRAKVMDERGIEWCEQNKETIVGWLREEAGKRKLPFIDAAGYLLVNRAIKLAKKDSKK